MTLADETYFALCDDLGSLREVIGAEEINLAESYEYNDFGEPSFFDENGVALTNSAIGNPYLFRVERYDPETHLGYTGFRYVDYEVGEFVTRRDIWGNARDLGNPRTFLHNNPVLTSSWALLPGSNPVVIAEADRIGSSSRAHPGLCSGPDSDCDSIWHGHFWDKESRWTECVGTCPAPQECRCTGHDGRTYKICMGWTSCGCVDPPSSVVRWGLPVPPGQFRALATTAALAERYDRPIIQTDAFPLVLKEERKPGKAGWVGVEVPCFVGCMDECEADADWWEVWTHAYCLGRCAIKCGTGGGRLYPDSSNKAAP